jgi:hypothetical protein
MTDYRVKKNINWLTRKRDALLKEMAACKPFVDGSVVKVRRKCGNENCRCARGEKHESLYLQYKVKGVTTGIYIPAELEEEVREWSREHKRIKAAMREVSKLQKSIIRQHVTEKKLKKGRS